MLMKLLLIVLVLIVVGIFLVREGWQSVKSKFFEEINEDTGSRKVYFGKKAIVYGVAVFLGGIWCLYQAAYFIFKYLVGI